MALNFNQYATEGNRFLKDYAKQLNMENEKDRAGRILTAILHSLRDIIPTQESLQLIAQLPMFLKAVYVNGWSVKEKRPRVKRISEFINLVKEHDRPSADYDFQYSDELAERYIDNTFIYLRKYVSAGEMNDIKDGLPKELKSLIFSNISI